MFLKQTTAYMYIALKVTCEYCFSTHLDIFCPRLVYRPLEM